MPKSRESEILMPKKSIEGKEATVDTVKTQTKVEKEDESLVQAKQEALQKKLKKVVVKKDPVAPPKSETVLEVESILEEDLKDVYKDMPADLKQQFKQEGESAASQIGEMLAQSKLNMGKVVKLIRKWLRLIPGINRFFLEQETKIKADKIKHMKP